MYNFEEHKRKEQKILGEMQQLVQRTLGENEEDAEDDDQVTNEDIGPSQLPPVEAS